MAGSRSDRDKKSRRKAVFLCTSILFCAVLLAGCANYDSNNHPLIATLSAFLPFGSSEVSSRAGQLQYASIDLTLDGRGGLLVLAEQQPGLTYWQSSRSETVVLSRGYLSSTAGLPDNLQMTKLSGLMPAPDLATPFTGNLQRQKRYRVMRRWEVGGDGRTVSRTADAKLDCRSSTESITLPLATLPLVRCIETLAWRGGGTTHSTYWIDAKDNRIWKAKVQPWPGAEMIHWRVARPWW